MPESSPDTILFDGVCNLCNGFVQFVIRHDHTGRFRFAALQSEAAKALLAGQGHPPLPSTDPESVLLLSGGQLYSHSTAVLRIAQGLGGVWRLAAVAGVLPQSWRDTATVGLAGRRAACCLPRPCKRGFYRKSRVR
jgi:predicted DCC family thiol-disulfide oxidoreductase YuxK